MSINYYLRMKNIDRLGLETKTRRYSLMEHSYMVGVLFAYFAKKESIEYTADTLETILSHDLLETVTGDLQYPVKNHTRRTQTAWLAIEDEVIRTLPEMKQYTDTEIHASLTTAQSKLFAACDLLDLWIFCQEERMMGSRNPSMSEIIQTCERLIAGRFASIDEFMTNFVHHGQPILPR